MRGDSILHLMKNIIDVPIFKIGSECCEFKIYQIKNWYNGNLKWSKLCILSVLGPYTLNEHYWYLRKMRKFLDAPTKSNWHMNTLQLLNILKLSFKFNILNSFKLNILNLVYTCNVSRYKWFSTCSD